jgi:hypothetical protein
LVKRFVVVLAACGSAPVAPTDQPIRYAPSVVVRLADRQDVFPKPPLVDQEIIHGCMARGSLARELYQPLLTYVRLHLARDSDAQAQLISDDTHSKVPEGDSILIEPRSEVGELTIESRTGSFSSGRTFCIHVRHDGNRTLIVLEPSSEWKS